MSWTKREFINEAFDEIGLASYVFDLTADQLQSALRKLDAMMAKWNGRGIRISYPLPSTPSESSLDAVSNVPDAANEAIYTNLGLALAPSYGKTVSPETKEKAHESFQILLSLATTPRVMQFPGTLPLGAGNKAWVGNRGPFVKTPNIYIEAGPDAVLDFF
jgi:hypothetical protein